MARAACPPECVARARSFASTAVFGYPFDAYEIGLVASEIATNAIRAAGALRTWPDDLWPIGMEMTVTARWTHLAVTDPDHRPMPASNEGGQLAENGRGLSIVDHLAAARWVSYVERGKTVHVVITAPGVELTAAELAEIKRRV
jgi:anti-sigma regulatory factor (Ser/Thr protein kinase)